MPSTARRVAIAHVPDPRHSRPAQQARAVDRSLESVLVPGRPAFRLHPACAGSRQHRRDPVNKRECRLSAVHAQFSTLPLFRPFQSPTCAGTPKTCAKGSRGTFPNSIRPRLDQQGCWAAGLSNLALGGLGLEDPPLGGAREVGGSEPRGVAGRAVSPLSKTPSHSLHWEAGVAGLVCFFSLFPCNEDSLMLSCWTVWHLEFLLHRTPRSSVSGEQYVHSSGLEGRAQLALSLGPAGHRRCLRWAKRGWSHHRASGG